MKSGLIILIFLIVCSCEIKQESTQDKAEWKIEELCLNNVKYYIYDGYRQYALSPKLDTLGKIEVCN